jgi:hypothetical protein
MRFSLDLNASWRSLVDWSDDVFDAGGEARLRDWLLDVSWDERTVTGRRYVFARVCGFEVWGWVR